MTGWRTAAVVCLALAACSGVDGGPPADATPVSSSTVPASTAPPADVAGICNGYLVLLRSGDPEPLSQVTDDPVLLADLETMLSSEGEFEAIAEAALRVEQAVVEVCAERFAAGVEPATDDSAALTTFLGAVAGGDQEAARAVAWENVVAQFSWAPVDSGPIEVEGASATMTMGPTSLVICEASAGVVVSCRFQER